MAPMLEIVLFSIAFFQWIHDIPQNAKKNVVLISKDPIQGQEEEQVHKDSD